MEEEKPYAARREYWEEKYRVCVVEEWYEGVKGGWERLQNDTRTERVGEKAYVAAHKSRELGHVYKKLETELRRGTLVRTLADLTVEGARRDDGIYWHTWIIQLDTGALSHTDRAEKEQLEP